MARNVAVLNDISRLHEENDLLQDRVLHLEAIVESLRKNVVNLLKDSRRCSGCGDCKDVLEPCYHDECINRVCYMCNIPALFGRYGERNQVACSRECENKKPKLE